LCFDQEIERGSTDNLKEFAGCGLLFPRLGQLALKPRIFFFCVDVRKRTFSLRRLRAVGGFRTDFSRFGHRGALRPRESFKYKLNINTKPIQLGDCRTVSHATETSVSGTSRFPALRNLVAIGCKSAIDQRTTRHPGYGMSQARRAMIECIFGWGKQHGTMRKTKHRGIGRVAANFLLNLVAYNLIRIPKLVAA